MQQDIKRNTYNNGRRHTMLYSIHVTGHSLAIILEWCQHFSYVVQCMLSRPGGLRVNDQESSYQKSPNIQIINWYLSSTK